MIEGVLPSERVQVILGVEILYKRQIPGEEISVSPIASIYGQEEIQETHLTSHAKPVFRR